MIMSGDDNLKKKKSRFIRLAFLLVVFSIFALVLITLIPAFGSNTSRLSGFFSPRVRDITVSEFNFDVGRDRLFTHMGDTVAAAGTLGVQVLDADGRETLRDSFRMTQPAIASSGGRCIAFDIGGSAVRVFSASQVYASLETEGAVVSASINRNGWACVVTQEGGVLRGVVTVYNSTGNMVYRVTMGSGFVLSAKLSPDNKNLAILNLTDDGSRITFYHGIDTQEDDADARFELSDELIIDIRYLSNRDVLAISTDSLLIVDNSGSGRQLYEFPDRHLGGYIIDGDFIALHLYDHGIGHQGRLVTLLMDGTILGEMELDREIISMSSVRDSLIVLKNDGLYSFNKELIEFPLSVENLSAAGASRVLAVSEDVALATSDNSAVVIRREEEH
jgi:hypothetical protein